MLNKFYLWWFSIGEEQMGKDGFKEYLKKDRCSLRPIVFMVPVLFVILLAYLLKSYSPELFIQLPVLMPMLAAFLAFAAGLENLYVYLIHRQKYIGIIRLP